MKKNDSENKVLKFILCLLLPYIVINSIIFFIIVDKPTILVDNKNEDHKNEIRFTIQHILPLESVSIINNEEKAYYYKNGFQYVVPVENNGTYKISATTINKMTANMYIDVSTNDDVNPVINIEDAIYQAGTLTLNISDNDSGINYDCVYGIIDGVKTNPSFIDKPTGTVKFKVSSKQEIIIHIEDLNGNVTESTITAD